MKMVGDPQSVMSDEALAKRVQNGDTAAFGELVSRYEEKLTRYGRRFLARTEDIEDVVQDVFLKAYENMQSYDASYRFSPWIYRIAHNAYVNVLRKHAHRSFNFIDFDTLVSPFSYHEEVENEGERRVLREALDAGLSRIDEKYREILVLHYFEELSYDEIAEVLRIPKGTVGVRLRRGREALKRVGEELKELHHGN
jgi:RNA polymerase sigma-70 factor (ECF subfamily)